MAARLPTPGGDAGNWGKILNDYLGVEHNADGSLKKVARPADLAAKADETALADHTSDTTNPHGVTASQTGAYSSDDVDILLSAKADVDNLGSAAQQPSSAFATAAQGEIADTAVQPSPELTETIEHRHEHENKEVLDIVTSEVLVPTGGTVGQVLTMGSSSAGWVGPAGLAYPRLFLAPGRSYDRETGSVSFADDSKTVPGLYGDAWDTRTADSADIRINVPWLMNTQGTIMMRWNVQKQPVLQARGLHVGGLVGIRRSNYLADSEAVSFFVNRGNGWEESGEVVPPPGDGVAVLRWDERSVGWFYTGRSGAQYKASLPPPVPGAFGDTGLRIRQTNDYVESVLVYDFAIPDVDIWRIARIPAMWTMDNTAVNFLQPQSMFDQFLPNARTTSGTTPIRAAPGSSAELIGEIGPGVVIEDSGRRVSISGADYALINTTTLGSGWISLSQVSPI